MVGDKKEPAPPTAGVRPKAEKHKRRREARRERERAGADAAAEDERGRAGPAALPVGSGWVDLTSGEELTAQEFGTAAECHEEHREETEYRLGVVRLTSGGPALPIACVFPEKANAPFEVGAGGTQRAPAKATLREWLASRGSEEIARWCLDVGVTSLAALVRVDESGWAAAAAVQPRPSDVPSSFEQELKDLKTLMTWA